MSAQKNIGTFEIDIDTTKATKNVHELRAAMTALARDTNAVPVRRIEWLAVAFIASQSVGNLALLGIAIALLRGHP
mgnify:CR=1 FL=1